MTTLEIIRFVAAAFLGAVWLICSLANLYIAVLAVCNRPSPSPVPLLGSGAGMLTLFIQPLPLGGTFTIAYALAILPDMSWSCGAGLARIFDLFRTPKHRFL